MGAENKGDYLKNNSRDADNSELNKMQNNIEKNKINNDTDGTNLWDQGESFFNTGDFQKKKELFEREMKMRGEGQELVEQPSLQKNNENNVGDYFGGSLD